MTQYQSRPGATLVDGLPISDKPWQMRVLGHETIIAVSEGHGAYVIANGKATPIEPIPAVLAAHAQFGGDLAEMQVRYDRADGIMFSEQQDATKW